MIKVQAQELRIGNLHKTVGLEIPRLTISSVKIDGQAFSAITGYGIYLVQDGKMEFEPIPLSVEWLEKFGWVWNNECNSYEKFPNGDARMNLSKPSPVNGGYRMFNYILHATISNQIFYVHQLQNLYFALTGKELILL